MSNPLPAAPAEAAPESPPPAPPPDAPLTLRQEEFCRHYAATGNAAAAARDAGYAEGSARQTGHDLLDRPAIAERVRASGRPGGRSSARRRRSCSAGSNRPGTPRSRRARRR